MARGRGKGVSAYASNKRQVSGRREREGRGSARVEHTLSNIFGGRNSYPTHSHAPFSLPALLPLPNPLYVPPQSLFSACVFGFSTHNTAAQLHIGVLCVLFGCLCVCRCVLCSRRSAAHEGCRLPLPMAQKGLGDDDDDLLCSPASYTVTATHTRL